MVLVSCIQYVQPTTTEQAARAGYWNAMRCSGRTDIPFDSIKRIVVKGSSFDYTLETPEFTRVFRGLLGFADFGKKTVLVVESRRDWPQLWGHEYLHMLSGISDHPDSLFKNCGLE